MLTRPYVFIVQLHYGRQDVASFFRKLTNQDKYSIGGTSNGLLTVSSLLYMGARPNIINMDFLLPTWKESIKSIKLLKLRTANREVVNIE